MVRTESSPIGRLSTSDIAPADLSYANWILSSGLEHAPTEVSAGVPSEYESEATALELPAVTIVAMSGSWHVTHGTRNCLGPGDLTFYGTLAVS